MGRAGSSPAPGTDRESSKTGSPFFVILLHFGFEPRITASITLFELIILD